MINIDIDFSDYAQYVNVTKMGTAGTRMITCAIRRKTLVWMPEELLRQTVIQYLIREKGYPRTRIAVEKQININGQVRRFDIVVYNKDMSIRLLIECKAFNVAVTQAVFDQAARYNMVLDAEYMVITNGLETYCCKVDHVAQRYAFEADIPQDKTKEAV